MPRRSFFSWLKGTKKSATTCRRRWSVRPRLEALEDRAVPAMITVTSLLDNTTGDGQVTLREALQAAETDKSVDGSAAGSGADTIVFDPALFAGGPQTLKLSVVGDTSVGDSAFAVGTAVTIPGPGGRATPLAARTPPPLPPLPPHPPPP